MVPNRPRASGGEEAARATHNVLSATRHGGHEKDFTLIAIAFCYQPLYSIPSLPHYESPFPPSTTRSPSMPRTRSSGSSTLSGRAHRAGAARMVRGDRGLADPGLDSASVLTSSPGRGFDATKASSGCLIGHLARALEALAQARQVVRRGEKIADDAQRIARIGRSQQDLAAAVRMQQRRPDAEAVDIGRLDHRETRDARAAASRGT